MGEQAIPVASSDFRSSNWPFGCQYFNAELMDAEGALTLLTCDATFHTPESKSESELLTALDITKKGTCYYSLSSSEDHFDDKLQLSDLEQGDTRIIFVRQKRRYFKDSTVNGYGMRLSTWLRVLSLCEILPDAMEVVHENNGGWGVHLSDCSDVKGKSCFIKSSDTPPKIQKCAYHIWMKPRPWWNEEHFVYARRDFHSGKSLLLVAGTFTDRHLQRLSSRFDFVTQPHLFSILLALITLWTRDLERFLWDQDFATQGLESETGWSTVGHTQLRPLPPEKLSIRKNMVTTKDSLLHVLRASESLAELFTFLSKEVRSLPAVGHDPSPLPDQLRDVFLQNSTRQWHQKQQASALAARIDAQWNAVSALVAQHNNGLNYQIAADSRADTIVMRRISFVTIAFLPATFLATFFSMTFFDVTSGKITVSPMIWIYVVCVIPVTLIIAWQSSTMALSKMWKRKDKTSDKSASSVIQKKQAV